MTRSVAQPAKEANISELMTIDCQKVSEQIIAFLQEKAKKQGKQGIVLGLSGGVDSATATVLATRAVGPANTHALYLPERDSDGVYRKQAEKLAGNLGIHFEVREIKKDVELQNTYKPVIMRIINFAPLLNRFIVFSSNRIVYPLVFRDTAYAVTLTGGRTRNSKLARVVYKSVASAVETSFNIRHTQRRKVLEDYAIVHNLLLVGAANRTESFVGWFVKGGVDDLPVEIILGLYKSQVRQLAAFLGVPKEIVNLKPSPDMWRGIGDEQCIGYPYSKIDKVAYVVEHNLDPALAYQNGISHHEFEDIKRLNELSAWKRENPHECPSLE